MPDEPRKEHPEEIESILSDLDAILTDMGGAELVAPKPEEAVKAPPTVDIVAVETPKAEPPKPITPTVSPKAIQEAPKAPPKAEAPPPPKAAAPIEPPMAVGPNIELAPREGLIMPPEKKPEPPKPAPKLPVQTGIELSAGPSIPIETVEPPKAKPPAAAPPPPPLLVVAVTPSPDAVVPPPPAVVVPPPPPPVAVAPPVAVPAPPSPTAVPNLSPVAASTKIAELPADTPKEQIRRVAYIYTNSCSEVKTACAAFLSQAARTISKRPIYLREVLSHEVAASSDPNAVLQKALQVKASAILAIVEDWPRAKIDDLSDACSRANVLFRAVAPADAQKKSTAVDIIVDMMLLPGEG